MNALTAHTVQLRLIGSREDVAFWLVQLEKVAELTAVSLPARVPGGIRVYATVTRRAPLSGGPK